MGLKLREKPRAANRAKNLISVLPCPNVTYFEDGLPNSLPANEVASTPSEPVGYDLAMTCAMTQPAPAMTCASWADIADLQWGPEFDDPTWDKAKGLLKAMAFSGFIPAIAGNRLVVTETRGPLTDDDRAEIAAHEADLIPLIRGRKVRIAS